MPPELGGDHSPAPDDGLEVSKGQQTDEGDYTDSQPRGPGPVFERGVVVFDRNATEGDDDLPPVVGSVVGPSLSLLRSLDLLEAGQRERLSCLGR